MAIVKEIQDAIKPIIESITGRSQIDYEYNVELNSDRGYENGFGFIPLSASFVSGRSIGFTTMDHTFQVILTDDFLNSDDDTSQNISIMDMYDDSESLLKQLQKSRLVLPTNTNRVLLISGASIDEPEVSSDNSTVVLRINFNINYSYINN